MTSNSNQYWNGSNGKLWMNDRDFDKVKSFEVKMAIEWEDIPVGLKTERALMGYGFEGTFAARKTDKNHTTVIDAIFREYVKGRVPDVSIISKAYNGATGVTERIKVSGITFDELTLQKYEEKSITEMEFPFKASNVEIL